jgi:SET domain-containing protein
MIHHRIVLKEAGSKGKGLFATALIKKGEVVWSEEGLKRNLFSEEDLKSLDPEYSHLAYWVENLKSFVIDDDDPGNYMNHSCNPNSWWVENTLVARRPIFVGEEITYDYATSDIMGINGKPSMECLCGEKTCRKTIFPNDLVTNKKLRETYKNHIPVEVISWLNRALKADSHANLC